MTKHEAKLELEALIGFCIMLRDSNYVEANPNPAFKEHAVVLNRINRAMWQAKVSAISIALEALEKSNATD